MTTPPTRLDFRHARVQRLRRLLGRRSAREAERAFVVEGAKLLGEALAAGAAVESLYVAPGTSLPEVDAAFERGARVFELAPGVLERVADTVTPQPVMAVVAMVHREAVGEVDLAVVCAGVRDPGNLGTVLRSSEAAGVGAVVCCDGSVDVYNPKTVRASAGSLFHVPVVIGGDPVAVLEGLGEGGVQRLGAAARAGVAHTDADLRRPTAFVLGNEATGLDEALAPVLDGHVHIPMAGRAESLNVGVAAAVLCFEAARQRGAR